ncbi:MAG: CopG family transcriptional regulator, partial [Sporichthyaceae bacterium]
MGDMVKTSVYLTPEDAAALRRVAEQSGRSQAELIRAAVATSVASAPERRFHSRGL